MQFAIVVLDRVLGVQPERGARPCERRRDALVVS